MNFFRKYLKLISLLITFILVFSGCSLENSTASNQSSAHTKDTLVVHFIDVGQADSILVQINNKNLLIDAGNKEDGNNVTAYLQRQGVKKLDYIVATHPHEDHIGGMSDVIKKIPIGYFYAPKITSNTKVFESMVGALNSKGKRINIAKAGLKLDLGENVDCELLAPNSNKYDDLNNYSAVIKLTYKNNKFLFMGDAEKISEQEMLTNNYDLSCDVLKVGHHGSSSSSSKEFLDKASPKIAVISCGKNNEYGHPHKETLAEFKKRNYTVYRTDIDGTVVLTSDGKNIKRE